MRDNVDERNNPDLLGEVLNLIPSISVPFFSAPNSYKGKIISLMVRKEKKSIFRYQSCSEYFHSNFKVSLQFMK